MLIRVTTEALTRIAASRSVLRGIDSYERGFGMGDDASRTSKGMLFVQNYAVYEYEVVEAVRVLVENVNSRGLLIASTRTELLAMALDPEFASVIDGSPKKTWAGRSVLLAKVRSNAAVEIKEGLFPKDGPHFRSAQLETIWSLFGLPGTIVPTPRLRGHIDEMVENRNRIAHGSDAPDTIGARFTITDLEKRIDDTEAVCTHIIASVKRHTTCTIAFSSHYRQASEGF